jgi:hypothetical protein
MHLLRKKVKTKDIDNKEGTDRIASPFCSYGNKNGFER